MNISEKLAISIGIIFLISAGMSAFFYLYGSDVLEQRVKAQLESVAVLKQNHLDFFFEEEVKDLENIARHPAVVSYLLDIKKSHDSLVSAEHQQLHSALRKDLEAVLKDEEDFTEIFMISLEGEVHVSTDRKQEGKLKSEEPYFIHGQDRAFIQSFYFDISLQQPATTLSAPVRDDSGKTIGVMAARLDLREISSIIIERAGLGETGETYLVNSFNYLVTRSRFKEDVALKETVYSEGVEDCLGGDEGFGLYKDYRRVPVIGRYVWMPKIEACLLAEMDQEEAFAPIELLQNITLIIALISAVLIAYLTRFFSRNISDPIGRLHHATEELEKGNFDVRVDIKTGDELEQLSKAFNSMIKAIGETQKEREEIDKAKTQFISITSHELRSPMTPMRAQLQMLEKGNYGDLNKKQKNALDIILRNTERLDRIIKDFLNISRIESARLEFDYVKTSLHPSIGRLVKEMENFMPEKNIKIKKDIPDLPEIKTDPDRIMQVLRNLLNNAIKFTPKGGEVKISAEVKDDKILFSVKDSGIGISKKDQARIFEPFYQAEQSIYREHGGTGLGLAICKGIVESQGGKIWVDSEEGEGTAFYFTVPFEPPKKPKPISLLFSPMKNIEKKVKDLFISYLGLIGKQEFEDLKKKKGISKKNIIRYFKDLRKKGIIVKGDFAEIEKKTSSLFKETERAEQKPAEKEEARKSGKKKENKKQEENKNQTEANQEKKKDKRKNHEDKS